MNTERDRRAAAAIGLAVALLAALAPSPAAADSHPQEVLDLVAGHQSLAMKIRPLRDRVAAEAAAAGGDSRFRPEGAPVRAAAATGEGESGADGRATERLRHKDRAVPSSAGAGDEAGRILERLTALEKNAAAEQARVSSPGFAVHRSPSGGSAAGFGDGRRAAPAAAVAPAVDSAQIADARRKLADLEREYAALEREASALGRR